MKPISKLFKSFNIAKLAIFLCSALLVSCGGGSVSTAGIGGTGISFGTVTDFGSIILNGSRIDDSTAVVTLDDNPGSGLHRGLKQGMVVKVSGDFSGNTGTASSIEYRDNLEGEVCDAPASVDGIRTLRVLGQTVILDATTIVDNTASIDTIIPGDIVEVSGLVDEIGAIHASFIEVKTAALNIEVKGQISALDSPPGTFKINDLLVDYTIVPAVIDNSIPGGLAVDQFVEVKGTGTCIPGALQTDTFDASNIELAFQDAGAIPTGQRAEIEGIVTTDIIPSSGLPSGVFTIGDRQVETTPNTRYLPEDFLPEEIVVGTKLEVHGTTDSNGVLTASKISLRENIRFESDVKVSSVSGTGLNILFTLDGFPNIIITTNSLTDIDPNFVDSTVNPPIVNPSGHVRIRGSKGPGNNVLATRIQGRNIGTNVFVQGPAESVSDPMITLLNGFQVDTSSLELEDIDDIAITRAKFFSLVQPGTLVKFNGTLQTGTNIITWAEAELEDD